MFDKRYSDKCLTLCMTFNCHSIVNKFTFCMNSVLIFWWADEQMFLPMWINEIGKSQDKSINEKTVSSISTNWSIQSISIKSDLLFFINLSIDKTILIFINWLLQDIHEWATVTTNATILQIISGKLSSSPNRLTRWHTHKTPYQETTWV